MSVFVYATTQQSTTTTVSLTRATVQIQHMQSRTNDEAQRVRKFDSGNVEGTVTYHSHTLDQQIRILHYVGGHHARLVGVGWVGYRTRVCEHDPDGVQCDIEEVVEQERGGRGETIL